MRTLLMIAALVLPAALLSPTDACAQDSAARSTAADSTAQSPGSCRQVRPGHLECTSVQIVGRTPSSFYLLSRARMHYESPPLRRGLVGEVRRSVRRSPF